MNELEEKLRKRRSVVEDRGLHFECPGKNEVVGTRKEEPVAFVPSQPLPMARKASTGGKPAPAGGTDLKAVLSLRRNVVDGCGETFESKPTAATADCVNQVSSAAVTRQKSGGGRLAAGGGADFRAIIDQQRATVDDGGQMFESRPVAQTADCSHDRIDGKEESDPPDPEAPAAQSATACPVGGGADGADGAPAAQSATACPVGGGADGADGAAAPGEAEGALDTPDASGTREEAAVDGGLSTDPAGAVVAEGLHDDGAGPEEQVEEAEDAAPSSARLDDTREPAAQDPTAAAAPAPEPACSSRSCQGDASADEEEEEEEAEEEEEGGSASGDPAAHAPLVGERLAKITNIGELKMQSNRITWFIDLRKQVLPEVFESPMFAIGSYEPVCLQLRPSGEGCELSLHGPSPRPARMRAKLFAGKGWAKKVLKEWLEGHDFVEKFNVNLAGRSNILCGVGFQEPN